MSGKHCGYVPNGEAVASDLKKKVTDCHKRLTQYESAVVCFSGGVDSALVLAMAVQALGRKCVLGLIAVSPSLPEEEVKGARDLARGLGVELLEVETHEMNDPAYRSNGPDRCLYCKRELFRKATDIAKERGMDGVVCGTNVDDLSDHRPGLRAAVELGISNPLAQCGFTKEDVRSAAKFFGLPVWNKPSSPCLASRVAYGEEISSEKLLRISRAETAMRALGFSIFRVRDHGTVARIEVEQEHLPRVLEQRETIVRTLTALGYTFVSLDLKGFRSGSMNEMLP